MMTRRGRVKQWIYSRLSLQILSFLIAVAIWFFVSWDHSSKGYRSVTLPLDVVGVQRDLLVEVQEDSVEARFFGDMGLLSDIDPTSLRVRVDVTGLPVGTYKLVPRVEMPKGAEGVTFKPQYVTVLLRHRSSRDVPVRIDFGRDFPREAKVAGATVRPRYVSVQGSKEQVQGVDHARILVTYEEFSAGRRVFPVELVFKKDYSLDKDLEVKPKEVTLDMPVSSDKIVSRVPLRASVEGMPDWRFSVESVNVTPDTVMVQGDPEAIEQLKIIDLPPVNVEGAQGDFSAWVPVRSPVEGVAVLGNGLAQVQVRLSHRPSKKVIRGVPVKVRGTDADRGWEVSPSEVDVTVEVLQEGSPPDEGAVEAYVDASNVVTSRITLPVLVKSKRESLVVLSVDPPRVQLQEKR
ncbi:MAG: CdaR family protein [Thermanaerothrix sp.]|nr:CdaR family protein [Thermanaerothrix sp.]